MSVPDPMIRLAAPRVAGRTLEPDSWTEFSDPYRLEPVSRVGLSGEAVVREAVRAATEIQPAVAAMSVAERAAVLRRAADIIDGRVDELATTITRQIGKAYKSTRREVSRSVWTFRAAATAAESLDGAVLPTTVASGGGGLVAMTWRVPVGVIGAVTPFNAPFNLVAHKLAPAFAAGNAVVVKPASQAALCTFELVSILEEAGAPVGAFNIVPGDRRTVHALATDPGVALYTLTGGRAAGEAVARDAGGRKVLLELGGNSPNIVHGDADVERAAGDCASGGFSNTGQSCNSVQRIYVHSSIADRFTEALVRNATKLTVGDPLDPTTDVGTLVNLEAAERVEAWLSEAVRRGARLLTGGRRDGASIAPTIVVDAPDDARIVCEEVFGPVVVILPYDDLDEAIARANASPYGLQAAVFTSSLGVAFAAASRLEAGGVLVNRSTNFRMDHLPYGGVKASGVGREGPAYAIEEMTELKLVLVDPDPASRPG